MLMIVPTAFIIAPLTHMLNLSETIDLSYEIIANNSFGIFAVILYIPVGIVAYLMPNDIGYFVMFFQVVFMAGGTVLTFVFFATTYPPKCLQIDPESGDYE
jgi:hypothetical protein